MVDVKNSEISIYNNRLSVQISYPGAVYKGSRFDWNGFITQVTLDGRHTFCVPESLIPGKGSGGQGFCGEFGIEEGLGYKDTYVNNYFVKIGVGHLKKIDSKPYDFFRRYPVVPHACDITLAGQKVSFHGKPVILDGYSYEYSKEIMLEDNFLIITYTLKNMGSQKIETTEYCHNFIGIDNNLVSSSYKLKIPGDIKVENTVGEVRVAEDKSLTWPHYEQKQEFYCVVKDYNNSSGYSWELYNSNARAGLREINDFPVSKLAIWGSRHVISPEAFIRLELDPGQTKRWVRRYEFFFKK